MDAPLPPRTPRPTAVWAFDRYLRRLAGQHLNAIRWRLSAGARDGATTMPTLFVANHTNWWDGFVAFLAGISLTPTFFILMEAKHLKRYATFKRFGAIPVDRESVRGAWRDLESARLGLAPGVGLWIFPQGRRRSPGDAIANCERGAGKLLAEAGMPVRLCPVAFRYAFVSEQLPEAFVLVGEPEVVAAGRFADRREATALIERRLGDTVAELDQLVAREALDLFDVLVPGRLSINKRIDRLRHRLGLLRGEFDARNG